MIGQSGRFQGCFIYAALQHKSGLDLYTLTYFLSLFPMKLYDIAHGTEFSRIDRTEDRDGHFAYFPSPMTSFPFLKKYIRRHMKNGKGHAILDLGCGKGMMLDFFSSLGFERVSGIEYDSRLCRLAERNLKRMRAPEKVRIYNMDALDFSEYRHYDTFYLYNPFDGNILEACIEKILSSRKQRPGKLTVFYCNPVYGSILREKGFLEAGHFYYKTTVFVYQGER